MHSRVFQISTMQIDKKNYSMSEASLIITSDGICRIATRYHAGGFTQLI